MASVDQVVQQWVAAGEKSRLRLLCLCRQRECTVGELAEATQLPQPAVSRHLKALNVAGLLARKARGRRVFYSLSSDGAALSWLLPALDLVTRRDRQIESDLTRLPGAATTNSAPSVLNPVLVKVCTALLGDAQVRRALLAPGCQADLRQWMQARVAEVVFQAGSAPVDLMVAEPTQQSELAAVTVLAAKVLAPGGRLMLSIPYDALDTELGVKAAHPLFQMRRSLTEAGFSCEQLIPVDLPDSTLLLALGRRLAVPQKAFKDRTL
jgi:DNA-binding transcriptional ArsR family regulator